MVLQNMLEMSIFRIGWDWRRAPQTYSMEEAMHAKHGTYSTPKFAHLQQQPFLQPSQISFIAAGNDNYIS